MERILEKTKDFALTAMGQNDTAHTADHVARVVALTKEILTAYPEANPMRTLLIALLHELNDDKLPSNLGLAAVKEFLRDAGASAEDADFVASALPLISYRKHPKLPPETPIEIRIVQDADRIDAMGAMGIARTFAYGGAKGRSLEESLNHFDEKLLKLYDLLSTEKGKEIARPRHEFLQTFYSAFQQENQI